MSDGKHENHHQPTTEDYVLQSGLWVPVRDGEGHTSGISDTEFKALTGLSVSELLGLIGAVASRGNVAEADDEPDSYNGELYAQCKALGDDMHDNGIKNTIYLDASARPAHVGVRQYLRMRYPEEALPNTYFFNPEGVAGRSEWDEHTRRRWMATDLLRATISAEYRDNGSWLSRLRNRGLQAAVSRGAQVVNQSRDKYPIDVDVAAEFVSRQPQLVERSEMPTMIVDTCAHSGESMALAKKVLKAVGFTDVRTAVVYGSHQLRGVSAVDFVAQEGHPEMLCFPFGHETAIHKDPKRLMSLRARSKSDSREGYENREAIRRTIIEHALNDPDVPKL